MTPDEFALRLPADLDDVERLLGDIRRLVARVRELETDLAKTDKLRLLDRAEGRMFRRERDELAAKLSSVTRERDALVDCAVKAEYLWPSSDFSPAELAIARADGRMFVASDGLGVVRGPLPCVCSTCDDDRKEGA